MTKSITDYARVVHAALVVLGATCVTSAAVAQEVSPPPASEPTPAPAISPSTPTRGVWLGLRLGYGIPFGKIADAPGASLGDVIAGNIPVVVDVGYRVSRYVHLGIFAQYAYALVSSSACTGDTTCSGMDLRAGLDVQVHLRPGERFDPWVGVGAGYEYASTTATQLGLRTTNAFHGIDLFELQGGCDTPLTRAVGVGPFFSLAFGRYSNAVQDGRSSDLPAAMHEWLMIGARGRVDL